MDTTLQSETPKPKNDAMPMVIPFTIVWQVLIALALAALSFRTINLEEFFNLGRPVQIFAAGIVLLPALVALVTCVLLLRRDSRGRYWAMSLNYTGLALGLFALLGQWGLFDSFERITDGVLANAPVTLGFFLAYAIYWGGNRFYARDDEDAQAQVLRVAVVVAGITLLILLFLSNILGGIAFLLTRYTQPLTWVMTIVTLVFGFVAYRLLMLADYFHETPQEREAWQGWLMLSPNIIGFMLFFAGPLAFSFYLSFTNSALGQIPEITGFNNYTELLSLEFQTITDMEAPAQNALSFGYAVVGEVQLGASRLIIGAKDVLFWISMRNTFVFVLLLLPLAIIPALGMALILNSSLPGVKFYRAIYFLPSVAAVVGTALIWRWLYDPVIGTFNYAITSAVLWLNSNFGLSLTDPNVQWLTGPGVVLFSVVLLAAWQVVGYNTVLFLAGLQGIPGTLYEAAMIDGANRWQQFRNVTLPLLAPTTFFVLITTMVTGLQVFNEPFALFPARPIPQQASTAVYYMYTKGFPQGQFGYSSAVAWVLFAVIFAITLLQFRLNTNRAYE